jgi:hypothetical protein
MKSLYIYQSISMFLKTPLAMVELDIYINILVCKPVELECMKNEKWNNIS